MTPEAIAVPDTAAEIRPLLTNAKIPPVKLPSATGESFDVNAAVREHRTILLFFRGGW